MGTCPGGTALVETRDWIELDLCGFLCGRSEENAVRGRLDGLVEESTLQSMQFGTVLGCSP